MDMKAFLENVTKDPFTHACWLNSLSYLEYRGFRKIARSQKTEDIDVGILSHAMEEVRHALFFKKLALRVGGKSFSHYSEKTLLANQELKNYFYNFDHGVSVLLKGFESIQQRRACYQFVTWLIEERAMKIYNIYDDILKKNNFEFSLSLILRDETKHLNGVRVVSQIALDSLSISKSKLLELEDSSFQTMWRALQKELSVNLIAINP